MSRLAQSVLIMLVGGVMIAITASGRFTSYVKPGFGPLLIAGGIVLLVAGVLTLILAIRGDGAPDPDDASAEPRGRPIATTRACRTGPPVRRLPKPPCSPVSRTPTGMSTPPGRPG